MSVDLLKLLSDRLLTIERQLAFQTLLRGLESLMSTISIDQSYSTQEKLVEIACKVYAYFERRAPEESEAVLKATHSSLREAFKKEGGPSLIYQDAQARRSVLNEVNADNPNLASFRIKEGASSALRLLSRLSSSHGLFHAST